MISRQCPACGITWHSADESNSWLCEKCGAEMPPAKAIVINGKEKTVVIKSSPPPSFYLYTVLATLGLPTVEEIIAADKPIQRMKKQAERNAKPLNYTREMERRKRQIEKGVIKVAAHD